MRWKVIVKWLIIAIAAAIIGIAGYYAYSAFTAEEKVVGAATATARVARGEIQVSVSGTGNIEPLDKQTVKSSQNGKIEEVLVEAGDEVRAGDVLARLESEDTTSQIRSKSLSIQKAEMDLEQLQDNYKQADEDSRKSMLISIQKSQLDLEIAREELAELQADEGSNEIVATIDGTITSVAVEAGVTINTNAEIAQIANYSQLKIVVPVDELDISKVAVGQSSTIRVEAFSDETFTGSVVEIADEGRASNGVASFDVTVLINEPKQIKSGMSAEASILVEQKSDVLMLPIDAVQSARGSYYVMLAGSAQPGQTQEQSSLPDDAQPPGDRTELPQGQAPAGREGQSPEGAGGFGGERPSGGMRGADRSAYQAGTGMAAATGQASAGMSAGTRVAVEVGIANEDYIEIVSGLSEGDVVILPTTTASSNTNNGMMIQGGFPGGGFGTTIPSGGAMPTGGGGGMSGGVRR